MEAKTGIVWFRQDLRLHDNEALTEALRNCETVIPVYVFDERVFKGKTRWFGFPKTDKYRTKFICESVEDLRRSLREKGSDLVIRIGKPEDELFKLARKHKSSWIFCNRERTQEEVEVQDTLEKRLWSVGQEMRFSRGKLLYHTGDLPFPITQTPDVFTQFRKEVERFVSVRKPFGAPEKMPALPEEVELAKSPDYEDFGHQPFTDDSRAVLQFRGGETEGLKRLHHYLWATDLAKTYKETRNELLGADFSTKFSPWLTQGCLSPKMIYHELKKYEDERGKNKSTYWIFFELLWRDFFRFMAKKHGNSMYLKTGMRGVEKNAHPSDWKLFKLWKEGRTGVPFIDANMREISLTGFMSNRGRQNVASFLVNDLKVNWQMGAEYFESILIDYDTASNWGNWNYIAGIGNDPREDRYFNILSQARRYDPNGEYVKTWLPELDSVPSSKVHRPDILSLTEQAEMQVKLGADYPKAMVSTKRWLS